MLVCGTVIFLPTLGLAKSSLLHNLFIIIAHCLHFIDVAKISKKFISSILFKQIFKISITCRGSIFVCFFEKIFSFQTQNKVPSPIKIIIYFVTDAVGYLKVRQCGVTGCDRG
jgi:hypothetical protein